jgi:plasmid stability protein
MALPKEQQTSYPLRMPEELRKGLEERAKAHGRSLNAEIIMILQWAVDNPTPLAMEQLGVDQLVDLLADKMIKKLKKAKAL